MSKRDEEKYIKINKKVPHDQQEKIEVEKEEELQIFRQLFFQI